MDTYIGNFTLTENKKKNLAYVSISPFKGVSIWENGDLYAVSEFEPTAEQIQTLANTINSIPETLNPLVYEESFDIDLMTKRISEVIDDSRELDLAPYLGAIQ